VSKPFLINSIDDLSQFSSYTMASLQNVEINFYMTFYDKLLLMKEDAFCPIFINQTFLLWVSKITCNQPLRQELCQKI